jgi:amidase
MDPAFRSATALADRVRRRKIGCLELTDHFIARIERLDGRLNAVVARDFEAARRRARALDRMKAPLGALHGVPMTVKESFDVAGLPTTWGVPGKRGDMPTRDALAVQRLRAAGAVILGKTNVPPMLADWQATNEIHGTTNNPWDLARSPGGSSGGSAAALAAGLAALECGSDIGGSIRQPAHACGVFGHKPTWGLLPMYGHSPVPDGEGQPDIACIGPLARTAADLALAMEVLAGPDPRDSVAPVKLPKGPKSARGLRVAVWAGDPATHTAVAVTEAVLAAGRALEKAGAVVSPTARPAVDMAKAFRAYLRLLGAVVLSRLPAQEAEQVAAAQAALRAEDRSADAEMLRAFGMAHGEWQDWNDQRHRMRRAWGTFFAEWDVLLCPAFAAPAQPHMVGVPEHEKFAVFDGMREPWGELLFWPGVVGAMLLPATAVPVGMSPEGLPIGCQVVGPMLGDRRTIAVAGMLEELLGGFRAPEGWG